MTVKELVKKYELGEVSKSYKNQYGVLRTNIDVMKLKDMTVKDVNINFFKREAIITIIEHAE